jgi:hypothetical protein
MKQLTLATAGFDRYAKPTRRAAFLAEMERVVPWPALCRLIAPHYPKPGNGRPPVGVERMLRIHFLQLHTRPIDHAASPRRAIGASRSISRQNRQSRTSLAASDDSSWPPLTSRRRTRDPFVWIEHGLRNLAKLPASVNEPGTALRA